MPVLPTNDLAADGAIATRQLTLDDVHRLLGAYVVELDMLRRENVALRAELARLAGERTP